MKTNSRKSKRPAEAKTSRTAKRKGDYVQRLVGHTYVFMREGHDWHGWASWGNEIANDVEMPNEKL